ncbi:multidrug efflux pump acriflavin resistance protein AcrB/AcrD/AcrF [Neoasaia chiangmaiensis NBRC 101099]|uniref:efflux RND transporter periplasmic adaptor subunit n=1 Tax=Neoasaia chiangmaiensis TaxID=320497 RepID=UPI00098AA780|nr:efflux RND transporter periplasmic adaptor subunit [Neoasaia chiangmaiensis]GBR40387.1 multidrug efflux pump acriflavin resistance protein AcrB/AcrD/AcrF [Neoasaia chiangmaiensis NBRC 101099]GEN13924.1 MexE family multidrug efflux RND transporter periplasmic adaptor subunit [Neoasaia chiangmaiensis]
MRDVTVCLPRFSYRTGTVAFTRLLPLTPLAVLSLGLTGCQRKAPPPAMPPQPVGIITVHPHTLTLDTVLPGRTDAYEQAEIRPQVGGVILTRNFEQGSDVKAGQLLYQINPAPYQAAYDQAKAQLLHAQAASLSIQAQLERYKPLAAAHAVSRQEYDNTLSSARQAEADIAQAKANVTSAGVNLDWTHVRSPIDGRIGRMLITPGTLVTTGQTTPIALVTRLDPIYADVNLADSDMLRLRREMAKGQLQRSGDNAAEVTLTLDDGSTYEQKGKLQLSEVTVDPSTGTLVMRAVFPNPDRLLLPGMFVHATINEGVTPNTLTVPQTAVQRDPKGAAMVMLVDGENKVVIRPIKLGRAVDSDWVVASGLGDGDKVIVTGIQKAHPGAKVQPQEMQAASGDAGQAG